MDTLEEIRQILRETVQIQQRSAVESDKRRAEFDAKIKQSQEESDKRRAEFDAKIKQSQEESDKRRAEFDAKLEKSQAEYTRISADLDKVRELQAENARASKETDRKLKELGRQIGSIGERFGSFTEGLAYPSLRKVLRKQYGIDNTVANYLKRFPDGSEIELDAFGFTNGTLNNAVVVEVKTHLQSKHIYEFKELLKGFKANFPEFANKHLYGVLVTPRVVSKELRQEIFENGLHLAIVHDEVFGFERNPNAIDFNYASHENA